MSFDYKRMQRTASGLMMRFNQGVLSYIDVSSGTDVFNPQQSETEYPLFGVVRPIGDRYRPGGLTRETDQVLTCAAFDVEPQLSGRIVKDGKQYQIVQIERIPAAGDVLTWRIFIRA